MAPDDDLPGFTGAGSAAVALAVYWFGAYLEISETVRMIAAYGASAAVGLAGAALEERMRLAWCTIRFANL
ncbi:MAG: hypothetical protein U1E11_03810 [Dethiobacteria bacterium]|nr:hypothetical protein [Dethiobacteria bacterium]